MSEIASHLPLAETSDAVLISRIRAGDNSAYGTLYERHLGAARGLARQLADGDAAEDAVQDTFANILDVIRRGGGPHSGFRPYLLTAVRRTVYDRFRSEKRTQTTDKIEQYDPGMPFIDPALEGLERSMVVRAFQSLPERWQAVLWHTEIEGAKPADVAPLLGLSANGVAALAYRAREGLRQAYLQMHLAAMYAGKKSKGAKVVPIGSAASVAPMAPAVDERCRPFLEKLGSYVRGGLAKRDSRSVEHHLDDCDKCKGIYAELADVNTALRTAIGPFILGTAAAAYLASSGTLSGGGLIAWWRGLPKKQQQAAGAGVVAAMLLAGMLGVMVPTSNDQPLDPPAPKAPPAAAPAPAPPGGSGSGGGGGNGAPGSPPQPPATPPNPVAPPGEGTTSPAPPGSPARPTVTIGTVGALLAGQDGIVAMAVKNAGGSPTKDLTADVALPPGVTYLGGASGRNAAMFTPTRPPGDGWACRPVSSTVRCTHAPLAPGAETSAYLHVQVAASAQEGTPPQVTLRTENAQPATAKAPKGVAADGLPARFAVDGRVRTVKTGNALLTCDEKLPGCREALDRQGAARDNDLWTMTAVDRDSDASTKSSSGGQLTLPPNAQVLWAGLYWSGSGSSGTTAKLRSPKGGAYQTVRANQVSQVRMPMGTAYQAFADVTSLVQQGGGGIWWGADVPATSGPSSYAGWSLVTVVSDPYAPYQQAMVLDGVRALGTAVPPETPEVPERVPSGVPTPKVPSVRPSVPSVPKTPTPSPSRTTELPPWLTPKLPDKPTPTPTPALPRPSVPTPPDVRKPSKPSVPSVPSPPKPGGTGKPEVTDGQKMQIPLDGLLASSRPAEVGLVTWEGDAGLKGDRLLLDGRPLTPLGGERAADNVMDGSAAGAIGPAVAFGTDIDDFAAVLGTGRGLTLITGDDAVLTGVVTVTAPMRN